MREIRRLPLLLGLAAAVVALAGGETPVAESGPTGDTRHDTVSRHTRLYDEFGVAVISDREYDALVRGLPEEKRHDPTDESPRIPYRYAMRGLPKVHGLDALAERLRRTPPHASTRYSLEPKYDGIALKLVYRNGKLLHALTRGDGRSGLLITALPLGIPRTLDGVPEHLEFAGELYVTREQFSAANTDRIRRGLAPYAHPRVMAAALASGGRDAEDAPSHVSAVVFAMTGDATPSWRSVRERLATLAALGFPVPSPVREAADADALLAGVREWESRREELGFETDGVVIHTEVAPGAESPAPFAYKFEARGEPSVLTSITFTVGRTGRITPIAHFRPVVLDGATVSKATLHNTRLLELLKLAAGDPILVERIGGTVPAIRPAKDRPERTSYLREPERCPGCRTPLSRDDDTLRCTHDACETRMLAALRYAVSRDALAIPGLNVTVLRRLVRAGHLRHPGDFHTLTPERLNDAFGGRPVPATTREALAALPDLPFARRLVALGLEGVGKSQAQKIATAFPTPDALRTATAAQIDALPLAEPLKTRLRRYLASAQGQACLRAMTPGPGRESRDTKNPPSATKTDSPDTRP